MNWTAFVLVFGVGIAIVMLVSFLSDSLGGTETILGFVLFLIAGGLAIFLLGASKEIAHLP